jgi:hypothetical protein
LEAGIGVLLKPDAPAEEQAKYIEQVRNKRTYQPTTPEAQWILSKLGEVMTAPRAIMPDTPAGQTIGENILPTTFAVLGSRAALKPFAGGPGLPPARGPMGKQRGMVIGARGMTIKELDTLQKAMELERAGKSKLQVLKETGMWYPKGDPQYRMEISDATMQIRPGKTQRITTVGNFIDHPELFARYPELKDVKLIFSSKVNGGLFNPNKMTIKLNSRLSRDSAKGLILHELQHYIQELEGWKSKGANIAQGNFPYTANYGEREARGTQQRRYMTTEQRRQFPQAIHQYYDQRRLREISESLTEREKLEKISPTYAFPSKGEIENWMGQWERTPTGKELKDAENISDVAVQNFLKSINSEIKPPLKGGDKPIVGGIADPKVRIEDFFDEDAISRLRGDVSGNSRSTTVYMTPNEFLQLSEKVDPKSPGSLSKQERIRDFRIGGKKFNEVPFLYVDSLEDGSVRVGGHEGRHRMMRLIEEGYGDKRIPVRLTSKDSNIRTYRWNSMAERPTKVITQRKNEDYNVPWEEIKDE